MKTPLCRILLFLVSALPALSGCGPDAGSDPATTPTTDTTQPGTSGPAGGPATGSADRPGHGNAQPGGFGRRPATSKAPAEVTGVAECDRFLHRYRACLQRVPKDMRGGLESALDAWHGTWKTMAASPATRGNLAAMCERTADNAWAAVARYDCPR